MHSASNNTPFESIFAHLPGAVLYTDSQGRILDANHALCELPGYTRGELMALTTDSLIHPDDKVRHANFNLELSKNVRHMAISHERYLHRLGMVRECRRSVNVIRESAGELRFIQLLEDFGEHLRADERFRETFDYASVGIMHSSLDRRVLMVNRKFCEMVGYTAEELQEGSVRRIHHPEDTDADQPLERRLVASEIDSFSFEKRYVRKDGSVFTAHRTVSLARDSAGAPKYFIRIMEDISARKQAEEQLRRLAHHDSLTELPNRNLFHDRLEHGLAQARRNNKMLAVMFLDLDDFKLVNDSFGHAAGDLLLRQVAHRLTGTVRATDTVSRLSGDEFGIIVTELERPSQAKQVAQKIVNRFATPFMLDDRSHHITMSIGI